VRGPLSHSLYLLFTPSLCVADPWRTLEGALDGGVDLVQWRVKHDDQDGARRCVALCAARGVPVIVNDDVDLALRIGAAGAHVGQDDMDARTARRRLGPEPWLGVSTHTADQLEQAFEDGADHVGFGPIHPTATKGYAEGQPEGALRAAVTRADRRPVFAIGGIRAANLQRVLDEGCTRIAVSSAILAAADPQRAAAELRQALLTARPAR
jgi:thiamine-phosphate pyrophosphorylase